MPDSTPTQSTAPPPAPTPSRSAPTCGSSPVRFDAIVLGLGAMGSAAAFHLACAGRRVLGLDRHHPPHTAGSSHGRTRIIREAYFEHPAYVPMVRRAYALWEELERQSGLQLLQITGGLMIGPGKGVLVPGARHSAELHRLPFERLSAPDVRSRFPALNPDDAMEAIWEPRAGILRPEDCVRSHLDQARRHGAELHYEEPATAWGADGAGVRVVTGRAVYTADHLVVGAGSWLPGLCPDLPMPLQVERQLQVWFEPGSSAQFGQDQCPIHLWETETRQYFYGLPDLGGGVKVARHHAGTITTPDSVDRTVSASEIADLRRLVGPYLPGLGERARDAAVCLYTNTSDGHFLLDHLPGTPQILVVSPCSGHGFKFAPAIGEWVARTVSREPGLWDSGLFRLRNCALHPGAQFTH